MADNPLMGSIRDQFLNSTPSAAFWNFFAPQLQGQGGYSKYLKGQKDDFLNQYQAAAADDPSLTYLNFLGRQDPMSQFSMQTAKQRGEMGMPRAKFKFGAGF